MSRYICPTVFWFVSLLPVVASELVDNVSRQLHIQGFVGITATSTWLGRTRIVAQRSDGQREIVLDSRTGEILRDVWQTVPVTTRTDNAGAPQILERPLELEVDGAGGEQTRSATRRNWDGSNWDGGSDVSEKGGGEELGAREASE